MTGNRGAVVASGAQSPVVTDPILQIRGLAKTFGGVKALRGVDLTVASGEIHGLLGQNGSGKSTLIKILAGFHAPDPGGSLTLDDRDVPLPLAPGDFSRLGMRFVHQDLGLIPSLSVLENLLLERLSTTTSWAVNWRRERREARELFEEYGLRLALNARTADLRPVDRALLAIVRAVSQMPDDGNGRSRGLLVLDEPTVFLPRDDTEDLFALTRRVVRTGAAVLFVSHDLDEVLGLTDRVTVLRDGRVVGTADTASTTRGRLVELIVGHGLEDVVRDREVTLGEAPVQADVTGLRGGLVADADLQVRRGEILGITGLSGSGFEDLPYLLFGVLPAESGEVRLAGRRMDLTNATPALAFSAGMALIPADRQRDGAILSLSVLDNVSMQVLDRFRSGPLLRRRRMARESREVLSRFDVRPADPLLTCASLSGGNQQKVLMAKWLQTRPSLLLVHEPTQGVDVGAREEIFAVLRSAVKEGMSVVCASSDYEQLSVICDRVLVFRQGRIVSEISGKRLTKECISECCYAAPPGDGEENS